MTGPRVAWGIHELSTGDVQALRVLTARTLSGEIAGFRITAFADPDQCAGLVALAGREAGRLDSYTGANVAAAHLGVPAIRHNGDPQAYFADAARWNAWQQTALGRGDAWNAPREVTALLSQAFPGFACGVARDADAGRYFHGIIRQIGRAPLHSDHAHRDFAGWEIGKSRQQLAWNVYLTSAGAGEGETIIYRKPWTAADEAFKNLSGIGYHDAVVAGIEQARYRPGMGDLVVFNSVNYHEVTWTRGTAERLSIGGFIGIDEAAGIARFWS